MNIEVAGLIIRSVTLLGFVLMLVISGLLILKERKIEAQKLSKDQYFKLKMEYQKTEQIKKMAWALRWKRHSGLFEHMLFKDWLGKHAKSSFDDYWNSPVYEDDNGGF